MAYYLKLYLATLIAFFAIDMIPHQSSNRERLACACHGGRSGMGNRLKRDRKSCQFWSRQMAQLVYEPHQFGGN